MTQLSQHFSLEELTATQHRGIDNTPDAVIEARLKVFLAPGLEVVREILCNHPMHINSGFRSVALNAAIGGSKTSAHCLGFAADFICPAFGAPVEIAEKIRDQAADYELAFDQLIYEHTWVHLSLDPRGRRQVLTFNGHGYQPGLIP